jgi:pilus assembly protein CpaB
LRRCRGERAAALRRRLTAKNLREIRWPAEATPPGAFKTVADLVGPEGKRVVLTPLEPNEPILPAKITGPAGAARSRPSSRTA